MSFRARLRLFFALIVIVPMIALAIVLFILASRSETGKADAGIDAGLRTAFAVYDQASQSAEPQLRQVAADRRLRAALRSGRGVEERMRELVDESGDIVAIVLLSEDGRVIARAGSRSAVAPNSAALTVGGRQVGELSVSRTDANDLIARVRELTGLDLAVFREQALLAASVDGVGNRAELGPHGDAHDVELAGGSYRGRVAKIVEPSGPPVELAVLRDASEIDDEVARNRLLIGQLLLAFLVLALISAVIVGRALTGQVDTFLSAARRLGRGDFAHPVPVHGNDEFAQLGREFNSMSDQLEGTIQEVEHKRQELEETIRRVGDALATGLDRDGVVTLAVRTAVDACEAESGRALPLASAAFNEVRTGSPGASLDAALEAAEECAFEVTREASARRRAVGAEADGAYAISILMRAVMNVDQAEYLGVMSIARGGREFARDEEELLEYLAGQATVSVENASLHELVERQAVTDELTGLANVRAFHTILDREIERARRFENSLGLVMVDLDNFKRVNDDHGHQQGDEVLAGVAGVLRDFSRDIDAPARYGGEELALVLPGTDVEGAELLAGRIREAIERLEVPLVEGRGSLRITASFGVAALPESARDKDGLVAAADAALYAAKRGGKNRVESAARRPEPEASSMPR